MKNFLVKSAWYHSYPLELNPNPKKLVRTAKSRPWELVSTSKVLLQKIAADPWLLERTIPLVLHL